MSASKFYIACTAGNEKKCAHQISELNCKLFQLVVQIFYGWEILSWKLDLLGSVVRDEITWKTDREHLFMQVHFIFSEIYW